MSQSANNTWNLSLLTPQIELWMANKLFIRYIFTFVLQCPVRIVRKEGRWENMDTAGVDLSGNKVAFFSRGPRKFTDFTQWGRGSGERAAPPRSSRALESKEGSFYGPSPGGWSCHKPGPSSSPTIGASRGTQAARWLPGAGGRRDAGVRTRGRGMYGGAGLSRAATRSLGPPRVPSSRRNLPDRILAGASGGRTVEMQRSSSLWIAGTSGSEVVGVGGIAGRSQRRRIVVAPLWGRGNHVMLDRGVSYKESSNPHWAKFPFILPLHAGFPEKERGNFLGAGDGNRFDFQEARYFLAFLFPEATHERLLSGGRKW